MKPFQLQDHKEIEGFQEFSVEVLAKINNEIVEVLHQSFDFLLGSYLLR